MGLPIWRDPEEKAGGAAARVKNDSTSQSRSPIRRASYHSRRNRPSVVQRLPHSLDAPPAPDAPPSLTSPDDVYRLYYLPQDDIDASSWLGDEAGERLRASRTGRRSRPGSFLPPPLERDRPQSRNGAASSAQHIELPAPQFESSEPTNAHIVLVRPSQSPHPLSFAHRPLSPDNGLGDRDRSPSPVHDAWHVMGSTITPDDTLPSTDSSFATTQPSSSFGVDMTSTQPSSQEDFSFASSSHRSGQVNDRRSIERLLYDLAMQTDAGRAQIQLISHMTPEETLWVRQHSSQSSRSHSDDTNPDANTQDDSAPPPAQRPDHFDEDIQARSRQVASQTLRFFTRRVHATDTPPRSRSPSPLYSSHVLPSISSHTRPSANQHHSPTPALDQSPHLDNDSL